MRQECKGAKSGCNLHLVLLWLRLDFTKIRKNHPGAHWRQTPQTNEPECQTQDKLYHIPILLPGETKAAWDALKPRARSAAPRDDDKVRLCNGAISWYWDRWRCKSCISSADITNQTSKPDWLSFTGHGHPKAQENSVMIYNHRSRQPPLLSLTRTRTGALMMFQLLKAIWKTENLSERTRRMQQGQEKLSHRGRSKNKPVLFIDVMKDHKVSNPTFESILTVPEPQLSVKQKTKIHHRRLKQN